MKIVLCGDLHTGAAGDDEWTTNNIRTSFRWMIDYMRANGITKMIQSGDWFDTRKAITHNCMEFNRTELIPMMQDAGVECYLTVGNHDMHWKNKITPNAPREILGSYDFIHVIDEPTCVEFDGITFDLIPWLCDENKEQILDFIGKSVSEYCVGHWELSGYYFYKGLKSSGYNASFLSKYRRVFSGHFHTISDGGNVQYLGTPYTLTAGDENDPRGFWVFDTETHECLFVPNPMTYHRRISYPGEIDVESLRGLSVRVVVSQVDEGLTKLETQLESITHSVKLIYDVSVSGNGASQEEFEIQSTKALIMAYVDENIDGDDQIETKRLLESLWTEAQSAGV